MANTPNNTDTLAEIIALNDSQYRHNTTPGSVDGVKTADFFLKLLCNPANVIRDTGGLPYNLLTGVPQVIPSFSGEWSSGTAYVVNQIVRRNNRLFACRVGHTSDATNIPPDSSTDTTQWRFLMEGVAGTNAFFDFQNAWTTGTPYTINQIVTRNNRLYRCRVGHTASSANEPTTNTDTTEWNFLIEGIQGITGAIGPQGRYFVYLYRLLPNNATRPAIPTATGYDKDTNIIQGVNPSDWIAGPRRPTYNNATHDLWFSRAEYNDADSTLSLFDTPEISSNDGIPGPAGPRGLRGFGLTARGNWTAGTAYNALDVVSLNGSSYLCLQAHTAGTSNSPTSDDAGDYWQDIAEGAIQFNHRGDWSAGQTYRFLDIVVVNGSSYVNQDEHTSADANKPETGADRNMYWRLLAMKGADADLDTIEDYAKKGTSAKIPNSRLGDTPPAGWVLNTGDGDGGLNALAVTALINDRIVDTDLPDTGGSTTNAPSVAAVRRAIGSNTGRTDADIQRLAREQITDANIPDEIARDSEIPDVSDFRTSTEITTEINDAVAAVPSRRTNQEIDDRADDRIEAGVEQWARDNSTVIPSNKLTNAGRDTGTQIRDKLQGLSGNDRLDASAIKNLPTTNPGTGGLQESDIKEYARATGRQIRAGDIEDGVIPDVRSDADIDGRVAPWARSNSPTGTIPDNRIPASIARDSEVPTNTEIDNRARDEINSRVQQFARDTTTDIPDAKIPSTIARTSAIPDVSNFRTQTQITQQINTAVNPKSQTYIASSVAQNVSDGDTVRNGTEAYMAIGNQTGVTTATTFTDTTNWLHLTDAGGTGNLPTPASNPDIQYIAVPAGQTTYSLLTARPAFMQWIRVHSRNYTVPQNSHSVTTSYTLPANNETYVFEFVDNDNRSQEYPITPNTIRGLATNTQATTTEIWRGAVLEKYGNYVMGNGLVGQSVFYFARTATNVLRISQNNLGQGTVSNTLTLNIYRQQAVAT